MKSQSVQVSEILREELTRRISRNPRYSLRAFARDLEMNTPTLSRIMAGTRGLSRNGAEKIAAKLNLTTSEREYFVELADAQYARGGAVRAAAQSKLNLLSEHFNSVKDETFRLFSQWHHFAILSLLETKGCEEDPAWIADKLSLKPIQVEESISLFLSSGMLERKNGKLRVTGNFFSAPDVPSAAVRSFHEEVLQKAVPALHEQSMDERDYTTILMPFDERDMEEAKRWIKKFREDFDRRFSGEAKRKTRVMALGIQFFGLSRSKAQRRST